MKLVTPVLFGLSLFHTGQTSAVALGSPSHLTAKRSTTEPFSIIAFRPKNPTILGPIEAYAGAFYINHAPGVDCSPTCVPGTSCNTPCPPDVGTNFYLESNKTAFLYVRIAGGEQVYVNDGADLRFDEAHETPPPYDFATAFYRQPGFPDGTFEFSGQGFVGWLACLTVEGGDVYHIFANISSLVGPEVPTTNLSDCFPCRLFTRPYTGSVVPLQYE